MKSARRLHWDLGNHTGASTPRVDDFCDGCARQVRGETFEDSPRIYYAVALAAAFKRVKAQLLDLLPVIPDLAEQALHGGMILVDYPVW